MQPASQAHPIPATADGWTHLELTDPRHVATLFDAVSLVMAAEDYGLKDIGRLTRALAEAASALLSRGARHVSVRFWVRAGDVCAEVRGGPSVEHFLLLKRYKMARITFERRDGQLVQTGYLLVH